MELHQITDQNRHKQPNKTVSNDRILQKRFVYIKKKLYFCSAKLQNQPNQSDSMPSKEVQNMIPKIQQYFATQPIEKAYLFGSCSRGEERKDSDVDLLVTYTNSDNISLLSICHMMNELSDTLGRPVDLIEEHRLLPFATESVNQDKMLIYERDFRIPFRISL